MINCKIDKFKYVRGELRVTFPTSVTYSTSKMAAALDIFDINGTNRVDSAEKTKPVLF